MGPIPFSDRLMMKTNQGSQEFSVEIFNVLGYMSYERSAIKEDEVEVNTELLNRVCISFELQTLMGIDLQSDL